MAFSGIESGIAEAPPTPFKWYIRNGRNGPKAALGGGRQGPEAAVRRQLLLASLNQTFQ